MAWLEVSLPIESLPTFQPFNVNEPVSVVLPKCFTSPATSDITSDKNITINVCSLTRTLNTGCFHRMALVSSVVYLFRHNGNQHIPLFVIKVGI